MRKLVLASASPTRKKILAEAGFVFEVDSSNYEEDMTLPMTPGDLVIFLSKGKAEEVALRHTDSVIFGADTIIVYQDQILGKPHTKERAKEMLQMLNGKEHLALTGFTVIDTQNNKIISKLVETKVHFKNLSNQEIEDYVATGESLDKAGGYAILELGNKFLEKVEGSIENVAGLPIQEVTKVLKEFGVEP